MIIMIVLIIMTMVIITSTINSDADCCKILGPKIHSLKYKCKQNHDETYFLERNCIT